MSRPLRIAYPGAWYHVMNRGRRSENVFYNDKDHKLFIKVLQETIELWNLQVSAYCLMQNHYHLLVHTPDGNLSRCMRHLNGVYTQRFNRIHDMEGQLFRGRYKAVLVEEDNHLLEVMRYIHRNPLKARIVKQLGDYPWSSHQGYLSKAKKWSWLQTEELLTKLTQERSRQKAAYLNFVSLAEPQEIERFYSLKNLPSILGNKDFKKYIRKKFSALVNKAEIPESKILAPEPEVVISYVCQYFKISRDELQKSKRGTENLPKDIAIYLVRQLCNLTLPDVGKEFGMYNYSSVSSVIQRVKTRSDKDKIIQKDLKSIRAKIAISQKRT